MLAGCGHTFCELPGSVTTVNCSSLYFLKASRTGAEERMSGEEEVRDLMSKKGGFS